MAKPAPESIKVIAVNKKARHDWEFLETLEAGISLVGSEVKSLRAGQVSFKDGYVRLEGGRALLVGVHIAPYEKTGRYDQHDPERPRQLLLHARQIALWTAKVDQKGLSVVPVRFYLKHGRIKLEVALARGKKSYDRRDELKQRDLDKDMKRQLDRY